MATPTIQRKDGKIMSVKVQPCHLAWSNRAYTWGQPPAVFTSMMLAMVAPWNTSSESSNRAG